MFANAPLGHVAHLWRYPIKSLAPEALASAEVLASGFAGDRGSALFVATPDRPRSGKPYRGKEHALLHTVARSGDAQALANARDLELERHDAGPYFDLDPVSLLFDTWLGELARTLRLDLDPLRYRPNIFATASAEFLEPEAALVGRELQIGEVRLRITQPINRCVTTTYDVATGEAEPRVLAHLVAERNNVMGVYANVERVGRIAPGDRIEFV